MKKLIPIAMTMLVALTAAPAFAAERPATVLIAGGSEADTIEIGLSDDGRSYVIDSSGVLEIGGSLCAHPVDKPTELICSEPLIGGFEINCGSGDDMVFLARDVAAPVTVRGGRGDDELVGGSSSDLILGGPGADVLVGRAGADSLFGGPGADTLRGGAGSDLLRGGPGFDTLLGGSGGNDVSQ